MKLVTITKQTSNNNKRTRAKLPNNNKHIKTSLSKH